MRILPSRQHGAFRTTRASTRDIEKKSLTIALFQIALIWNSAVAELPTGYWDTDQSQPILDVTLEVTLAPDLSHLTSAESQAVLELLAAGRVMNDLYEAQRHREAPVAKQALLQLHDESGDSAATQNLLDLWYLSKGPVATTLENKRLPFVPVAPEQPGKTVYPDGLTRDELDTFLAENPAAAADILDVRNVVRRSTTENIAADIAQLDRYPGVDALHIGLRAKLQALVAREDGLYAVPYALAYAQELGQVRLHLSAAANLLEQESPDFAAYLNNKARDLLSGNYESGDASWVTGKFDGLNIQIGSYETYDDSLYGVKAFFSASILARDKERSRELDRAMAGIQDIEDSLPYAQQKMVRSDIPVGVYNIIADFGQARGGNTATILPNDADHSRKYGRTILLRNNIMTNPVLFANKKKQFDAVIDACCRDHLMPSGGFNRTLWHEIGHYLGVSRTANGRDLDNALADLSDLFEEMKSDLVSLYAAPALRESGFYDDVGIRAAYAGGIHRTLQTVQPRIDQPYQNMQLMQFNFFMEHGLIEPNSDSGLLEINYERYHEIVTDLLRQVLHIQYAGDRAQALEFVQRWNYWDDNLHGGLAQRMRDTNAYRRTLVRYKALANN